MPAATFKEFRETAMPMLLALGPYAYSDPVLLYKIIRDPIQYKKLWLDF